MMQILPDGQGKIMGVRTTGKLTDQDYQEVLIPSLEAVIKEQGKAGGHPQEQHRQRQPPPQWAGIIRNSRE
jgi:hypothetical protein